ncbi:MAG: hypothetical protein R3D33_14860 [Hyphomicrobiaceae bacterium]
MASQWHPETGAVASDHEIELMASVLEGRHGVWAAEVADFLATAHKQAEDSNRSEAWSMVARTVRRREHRRCTAYQS